MSFVTSASRLALCVAAVTAFPPADGLGWPNLPPVTGCGECIAITNADESRPSLAIDPAYRSSFDELKEYFLLNAGWDGYEAAAPNKLAIQHAMSLLSIAWEHQLPPPRAMVSPTGEVGLYWRHGGCYAELGIDGSDSFYWFVEEGDAGAGAEVHPVVAGLPQDLIDFLRV